MKPLIGITTCSTTIGGGWSDLAPDLHMDYVFREYVLAVESAGGLPVVIPVPKKPQIVKEIMERVDGLLLTGGDDIAPRLYGEEPVKGITESVIEIDRMEIEALRAAKKRRIPILGICRGMQILTIAFGGTLYQDIFTQLEGCIDHEQKMDKGSLTHQVKVHVPSKLFNIVESDLLWVNSHHHQAVKKPPKCFNVVAHANDGIIEGIEHEAYPFLIGVQWHPEGTWPNDETSRKLFSAFIDFTKQ